jgi:hypothetical protein
LGNLHANSQITCQEIETSSVDQRAEGEQPATFSWVYFGRERHSQVEGFSDLESTISKSAQTLFT